MLELSFVLFFHCFLIITQGQHKPWWFLEHSGDMQHLLLTKSRLPWVISENAAGVEKHNVPEESSAMKWKAAIEHYFKSIASVLLLQQICLNPHKDITREQVNLNVSFGTCLLKLKSSEP